MLSLLLGVGVVLFVNRPESAVLPPDRPTGATEDGADTRADAATELLDRLGDRLEGGTRRQVVALAAPGDREAARELATIHANVRALRITDLSLRYVDENAARLSADREQALGERGWVGDVELDWRLRGFDAAEGHLEITLTFADTARGAAFVSARDDYGEPAPLWLLERLSVERSRRALVMAADDQRAGRFLRLANQAVLDVRKVLPDFPGRLVVELPGSQRLLARAIGAEPGSYTGIAAVTTTVDGSLTPDAPAHIFVNRRVFDPLGPRGSQIVMSHEATHVATQAAVSSMPTWLLEGFADYVALAHVDLPVSITGSQILVRVREDGPPKQLPGRRAFDPESEALGASYESAWLACRLLAEKYGEKKLVAFYRESNRVSSTEKAFGNILGTDDKAFTRAWRNYLRDLAG